MGCEDFVKLKKKEEKEKGRGKKTSEVSEITGQ